MRTLYLVIGLSLIYLFMGNQSQESIVIPDESIRFRVVANSNEDYDQLIKTKVKQNLETVITNILEEPNNIKTVENAIKDNMDLLNNTVKETLINENYLKNFNISFGKNYFPKKELYGVKYNEGEYQSLVVTLGEGLGNNWWCVLFPPLCLIEAEEATQTEYRIYVKDILEKYL